MRNRRHPHPSRPSPSARPMGADRAKEFHRRARDRCFLCLESGHLVAACQGRIRCIGCRRSGHRERDCWYRQNVSQVPAPVCSGSPAVGPRCPLDRSWAAVAALPVAVEDRGHLVCLQQANGAASAGSAIPPNEVLKFVFAEQSTLLRAELKELASSQIEELARPLHDVSESLQGLIVRLGSLMERAVTAMEGLSLASASVQASSAQHPLAAAPSSPPLLAGRFVGCSTSRMSRWCRPPLVVWSLLPILL